jgi:hypothetical protein
MPIKIGIRDLSYTLKRQSLEKMGIPYEPLWTADLFVTLKWYFPPEPDLFHIDYDRIATRLINRFNRHNFDLKYGTVLEAKKYYEQRDKANNAQNK